MISDWPFVFNIYVYMWFEEYPLIQLHILSEENLRSPLFFEIGVIGESILISSIAVCIHVK